MNTMSTGERHLKMKSETLNIAVDSIVQTWNQGRRVLVVLGAGASVSAGIPDMTSVFKELHTSVEELNKRFASGDNYPRGQKAIGERLNIGRSLTELRDWLDGLASKNSPRSVAAMTLGALQRAHSQVPEQEGRRWFYSELSDIWSKFSRRFVNGEVGARIEPRVDAAGTSDAILEARQRLAATALAPRLKQICPPKTGPAVLDGPLPLRDPSPLHFCVAGWALQNWVDIVSLNFDGLTKSALRKSSNPDEVVPVVLTEPKALQNYFLGNPVGSGGTKKIIPIIKVWGDVFHAVCTSQQCPEYGNRIAIYELDADRFQEGCPACRCPRQLQIFFTGYEDKERTTDALMRELLKYVAPRIGCIVTIGFSGLWDRTLVNSLVTLSKDLSWENKHLGREGVSERASWICVDPVKSPALLQDLAAQGLAPIHLQMSGDEFASVFDLTAVEPAKTEAAGAERYNLHGCLEDGKWDAMIKKEQINVFPKAYECFMDQDYLRDFKYLRQLGIKTKIALARTNLQARKGSESDHNRQKHSWGTTALSALWFRQLAQGQFDTFEEEKMATIVVFAAMHHDIGHLPFTHLAEEIFEEVHWSLEDWADAFRHDEPVLGNCIDRFREQIQKSIDAASKLLRCSAEDFHLWVEGAIQGRSGYPWIDAILNSPLDVDKLDYVFRDCDILGQGIHISTEEQRDDWIRNLFRHTRVLPSGLVALAGEAGEQARDFLEERRWLYKHQYYQPGYRALERLAAAVTLQWLLHRVPEDIALSQWHEEAMSKLKIVVKDTSAKKGVIARNLLWTELLNIETESRFQRKGEPGLLLQLTEELANGQPGGLPPHERVKQWANRCFSIFQQVFDDHQDVSHLTLLQFLTQVAGMTCSESVYVAFQDLKRVREIVRELETLRPFRALFDIAVMPRMLSYPARRRLKWGEETVLGECFAVAHRDPDRWSSSTNHWIPLSESAFGERDKARWAKMMVVSAEPNDPEVAHALDRFRTLCRQEEIRVKDVDPDEALQ